MRRLFISLYLDEDVDVVIESMLKARGFPVTTTLADGNRGANDNDQLAYAADRQMAVLTHNRQHFEHLFEECASAGRMHSGIIIAVRRPAREVVRRLITILNHVTADEMDNQLRYI